MSDAPNAPASLSTAEATVETLVAAGLTQLFALPGVHNDPLFDAFFASQDRLKIVHSRHEQSAAYMALGAALATGKPQAFSVVPGPGFLNASAAMLTAQTLNAPVLALSGQIPQREIDRGHGYLHELRDQIGLARHFSKYADRIRAPHEAPDSSTRRWPRPPGVAKAPPTSNAPWMSGAGAPRCAFCLPSRRPRRLR